jgi:hypothetical protein
MSKIIPRGNGINSTKSFKVNLSYAGNPLSY